MHNWATKIFWKGLITKQFPRWHSKVHFPQREFSGEYFRGKFMKLRFQLSALKLPLLSPCAEWKTWKGFRQRRRSHERILRLLKGRKGKRRGGDCFPRNFRQESWELGSWQRMEGREGGKGGPGWPGVLRCCCGCRVAKKEKAVFLFRSGIECDVKVPLASPLSHTTELTGSKQSFYSKLQECVFSPRRSLNYRPNQH